MVLKRLTPVRGKVPVGVQGRRVMGFALLVTQSAHKIVVVFAQDCESNVKAKVQRECFCPEPEVCSGCIIDYEYGPACWLDFTSQEERRQTLDIYLPSEGAHSTSPMLIWLHGLASSKSFMVDGVVENSLILPALKAGFVVVSVAYRHPIIDLSEQPTPNTDVLMALQVLRCTKSLEFAHHKVVIAAHSRGTLGLWSALQDDYIKQEKTEGSSITLQSTSVQAVWAVNAGVVLWPNWIIYQSHWYSAGAQLTIPPKFFTLPMLLINKGNALQDVTVDDPPVMLKYTEEEHKEAFSMTEIDKGLGNPYFNPKHGTVLCEKYHTAFEKSNLDFPMCSIEYGVPNATVYDGALTFFQQALAKPHTQVPKPRVSPHQVNFDENTCPPILFTTGRIIFVAVAAASLLILLIMMCCGIVRRIRRMGCLEWSCKCTCTNCFESNRRVRKREQYRRPCAEPGCDRFRLPGMKWCMQHGGVVMYESTIIPT